ncbi:ATP-NAD kinase family protein [Anaeroselena agilis]|uniref:NAD(+)/NADH kinase n=1 Tax=Anaeroselena agilis TaxID=3063788 RepID=A0ABU3NXW1_9FIRM|nr:NAD(+)/NADH kinase [Selenomonadales bacterium 4137-cl]
MTTVGIIANPASGKDIRRLVAYGTVFDNQEKVNIVRRILLGLAAAGVRRVIYMPDYYGIVPRAVEGLSSKDRPPLDIVPADVPLTCTQQDSAAAAAAMRENGAACIVTLGGDGTNRLVAKGCGDVPLLPVSTGTNNVFPAMMEGTIAGLAAGAVACGLAGGEAALRRAKKLLISKDGAPADIALVDAVVLDGSFIGSRAIWEVEPIRQIVLTQCAPHAIGISAIGGQLVPVGPHEERGLTVEIGGGGDAGVLAPIAPGVVVPVRVKTFRAIALGEQVPVAHTPCVIALDGEREVEIRADETAAIQLTAAGPLVVDAKAALAAAAANGAFRLPPEAPAQT